MEKSTATYQDFIKESLIDLTQDFKQGLIAEMEYYKIKNEYLKELNCTQEQLGDADKQY